MRRITDKQVWRLVVPREHGTEQQILYGTPKEAIRRAALRLRGACGATLFLRGGGRSAILFTDSMGSVYLRTPQFLTQLQTECPA